MIDAAAIKTIDEVRMDLRLAIRRDAPPEEVLARQVKLHALERALRLNRSPGSPTQVSLAENGQSD